MPEERDLAMYQEMRLALVFNGGVSLAVWMGGVAKEIDRFRTAFYRSEAALDPYAALLDAVRTEVVTDVIAGTSAGGINGAMLGYVVATGKALETAGPDADPEAIRKVWEQLGSIDELLDEASRPTSGLNGDFLFQGAADVFHTLSGNSQLEGDPPTRMRLTITATDSKGYAVEAGGVSARDHRLEMRFRRVKRPHGDAIRLNQPLRTAIARALGEPPGDDWPFAESDPDRDLGGDQAPALLARAARTTASFPIAFGPSALPLDRWIPALAGDDTALTATPPMRHVISTKGGRGVLGLDPNRYAVDGGIWDNAPFEAVLRAIDRSPASRDIDRRLVYVIYTDEELPEDDVPADAPAPDEPPKLVKSVTQTLTTPSNVSFANDLERIRSDMAQQRARHRGFTWLLKDGKPDVFELAPELLPLYARRVTAEQQAQALPNSLPARDRPLTEWKATPGDWGWDARPVQVSIETASRLIRQVLRGLPIDTPDLQSKVQQLTGARDVLSQLAWALSDLQDARHERPLTDAERTVCGLAMAQFADTVSQLHDLFSLLPRSAEGDSATDPLDIATALTDGGVEMVIKRAIATEISMHALNADDRPHKVDYSFETIRPDMGWPLPPDGDESGDRPPLAGVHYGHFGGFLLTSWRLSDWMWGRLDASTRIVDMLLDGDQFRRLTSDLPAVRADLAAQFAALAIPAAAGVEPSRTRYLAYAAFAAHGLLGDADAPSDPRTDAADLTVGVQTWRDRLAREYETAIGAALTSLTVPLELTLLRADVRRQIQYAILDDERPGVVAQILNERANPQLRVDPDAHADLPRADVLATRLDGGLRQIVSGLSNKLPTLVLAGYAERAGANTLGALGQQNLAGCVRALGGATKAVEAIEHAKYAVTQYILHRHRGSDG